VITAKAFRGKRYAVLGLARSGLATVQALVASAAEVLAWDEREAARDAVPSGVSLADPLAADLRGYDGIIVSPGVPINRHPIAEKAKADGVPIMGDIELFAMARAELPPHKVVGITGTNGKSTTTALIHHILKTACVPTTMGGNIGLPILSQDALPEGGIYVLELSSFQIDLTHSLDCDIAVLTNITPDHLDRYDGFADYAASKERLFTMQHVDKVAVIAINDDPCRMIASRINHRLHRVTWESVSDQSRWPALQGPHNAQNVVIAIKVAESLGLDSNAIEQGLRTYPGLPHRMERIRELDGVLYVNDSKATNATSTAPALAAYPAIHWIAGGQAKTKDLDACAPHFDHVKAAYTIGEAGPMFAELLAPHMPAKNSGTLQSAILAARAVAQSGEVILLSPACASFDQFKDFEDRGNQFRAIVEGLS
jgi:UDP-N-acetylmuramoylalanine--D-glutamate ligase